MANFVTYILPYYKKQKLKKKTKDQRGWRACKSVAGRLDLNPEPSEFWVFIFLATWQLD